MKVYELVAAMVLRAGLHTRQLTWSELGDVFGVTNNSIRHTLNRFKDKYNVVVLDIEDGWNREFLSEHTPESEKDFLKGLTYTPGDAYKHGLLDGVRIGPKGQIAFVTQTDKVETGVALVANEAPAAVDGPLAGRVTRVVADQMGLSEDDVKLTHRFVEDLGADSLDLVELVMALEDEFEREIGDEEAENTTTVQEAVNLIAGKLGVTVPVPQVVAEPAIQFAPPPVANEPEIEPLKFLETPNVLVVIRDGAPVSIDKSHKNFDKIKEALNAKHWQKALDFIDMKSALNKYSNGRVTVEGGNVYMDGERLYGKLVQRLVNCLTEENTEALEALTNFLANCDENPDHRVVTRIYDFITHTDLRLTKDGHVLAYKIVENNYLDKYTKTMDNSPGKIVEMKRNKVNPNDTQTCSFGLHVAAKGYLSSYGNVNKDRVVLCKVHPRDFVSIPTDYNNMKARTCRYEVLKDVSENFRASQDGLKA